MDFAPSTRKQWPLGLLLFGLIMLVLALLGTFTGKTYGRGSALRATDPMNYWTTVIVQYLLGLSMIWLWLATSN
jgi:hypothetical protein